LEAHFGFERTAETKYHSAFTMLR